MNDIRVSVCMVTYNQKRFIAQAIESVLMQKADFKFQLIVGDDASTDGTTEIIQQYAKKYPDIVKPIFHKKNVGPFANSMSVYRAAKTEYVAILDGDDYWTDENKLQKQVDFLDKNTKCSLCYHKAKIIFENQAQKDVIWPSEEYRFGKTILTLEDLAIRNPMYTNTIVYRWRFVDENIDELIPEELCPGDYFLALLHAEKGNIGFIDETMSVYRRHDGGMSADLSTKEALTWLKYGFFELKFHYYVDQHFKYKLAKYFRDEKIKKCVKVLKAYQEYDQFDKLKVFQEVFPEYYELAKEFENSLETGTSENKSSFSKYNKKLKKLKKIAIVSLLLAIVNFIGLIILLKELYFG